MCVRVAASKEAIPLEIPLRADSGEGSHIPDAALLQRLEGWLGATAAMARERMQDQRQEELRPRGIEGEAAGGLWEGEGAAGSRAERDTRGAGEGAGGSVSAGTGGVGGRGGCEEHEGGGAEAGGVSAGDPEW